MTGKQLPILFSTSSQVSFTFMELCNSWIRLFLTRALKHPHRESWFLGGCKSISNSSKSISKLYHHELQTYESYGPIALVFTPLIRAQLDNNRKVQPELGAWRLLCGFIFLPRYLLFKQQIHMDLLEQLYSETGSTKMQTCDANTSRQRRPGADSRNEEITEQRQFSVKALHAASNPREPRSDTWMPNIVKFFMTSQASFTIAELCSSWILHIKQRYSRTVSPKL